MTSRLVRALLALVLAAITGACERPAHVCTLIGGINSVTFDLNPAVVTRVASIEVTLCQGDRCRDATVRRVEGAAPDAPIFLDLDRSLGGGWKAGRAKIAATGRAARGEVVVRRTDTFRWTLDYPNGKQCDTTPFLHHTVRLGG
jgi:hypothetical protein